jgi:ABC-type glycerol-3-phosphate transport system substrate-binding protein
MRPRLRWVVTLAAVLLAGLGLLAAGGGVAKAQAAPPATTLGIWTSAEDSGSYSAVSGQSPNVANYYLDWGSSYPS